MEYNFNEKNETESPRYSESLGLYNIKQNKKKFIINTNNKLLLLIIILLQLSILGTLIYVNFFKDKIVDDEKIIEEVSKEVDISEFNSPQVATVVDAENLKNQNEIHSEVYKDAKNGDYIVFYEDKMIIYRKDNKKVIYNGKTPAAILEDKENEIKEDIIAKAKESGIIAENSSEEPSIVAVTNGGNLRKTNPVFYSQTEVGDLVVTFEEAKVILLYNPSTKTIYNSGSFSVNIQ